MLFSQRMGLKPESKLVQRESIDEDLRNKIWNVLTLRVWEHWEPPLGAYSTNSRSPQAKDVDLLISVLWFHYFKRALDQMPRFEIAGGNSGPYGMLREIVMHGAWNEVFDLIEFIVKNLPERLARQGVTDFFNGVFTQENSAYRFVGSTISEITDENEIGTVEEAISINKKAVSTHLKRALELLNDRKTPDYRNSMKESISAVEAVCQEITGKPGATLNQCIAAIKARRSLHPAFEGSLVKLFGFTSDFGGIRHAMTDETERPTYADAKYMLVTCSAVTNYFRTLQTE